MKLPSDMSDQELLEEFDETAEHGPVVRLDEVMREICERWADEKRAEAAKRENEYTEGYDLSAHNHPTTYVGEQ